MEKQQMRSARVQEWRVSGVSMSEFSRTKEYTASNLSYWVKQLASASTQPAKSVRLARVVRSRPDAAAPQPRGVVSRAATDPGSLVFESGALRVQMPSVGDGARLEAVLLAVVRAAKAGGQ
jgi:hypothetical protein